MEHQFISDPKHEALVRKEWQEKVHVRLKDMVNKAANEPPDEIITWMTDDVHAVLKYKSKTDEEFKKRSERTERTW